MQYCPSTRIWKSFFFRTAKKLVDLLSECIAFYERILLVPRLLPDCFSFKDTSQCAVYPCDDATTTCEDGTYPACVCKEDFTKTAWDTYSCSGKCHVTLSVHENLTWSSPVSVFLNSQTCWALKIRHVCLIKQAIRMYSHTSFGTHP